MKVVVYEGQSQAGGIGGRRAPLAVAPRDLAAADICITTYDALRRDLNHQPDGEGTPRALRGRKKYEVRWQGFSAWGFEGFP